MKLSIKFLCLCGLLFVPSVVSAIEKDSLYIAQFVRNSFTRYGVRNALVTVMDSTGHVIDTLRTEPGNGSHDAQVWTLNVPRRPAKFRIRVEHPDYVTGEMTVEMKHPARLNSYRLPDMLLERNFEEKEVALGEATVTATRVKLYHKGDTIVVDARAFKLSEGSMLESLVRSVPGCELRENGDIYMNGRKVDYLTLNGKDFFKGDNRIMLDNLPYYTVDKLQFFNQRSERSEMMGVDLERPDYVMNVKLKKEYSIGYLGNVEAGAGTEERWMGRAFALRFTDNSRLSLYANANNVNNTRTPGENGGWGEQNNPVGDTDTYNLGGEWLTDDKMGRYKDVLKAKLQWNKAKNEERTASQQFLQDGDVFGYGNTVSTVRDFSLKADNHLTLKRLGLVSDSRFEYANFDKDETTRSALLSAQQQEGTLQVLDSIFSANRSSEMTSLLVNSVSDVATASGHEWTAEQKFSYDTELPWGDYLALGAGGTWNGKKENGNSDYWLKYANGETPDDIQQRLTKSSSRSYQLRFNAHYTIHFLTGWNLSFTVAHNHQHSNDENNLYRLDWAESSETDNLLPSVTDYLSLRDDANSPHNVSTQREEHVSTMLSRTHVDRQRGRFVLFSAEVDACYANQDGVFSRGERTVGLSDHRWLFNPTVNFEYETRNWRDRYAFHYETKMQAPNLLQTADLTDTSNPLAIQNGNPDLRPSTNHMFTLHYNTRFTSNGKYGYLVAHSEFSIMQNLVAMNAVYNTNTGAYTYTPVNVNGNWNTYSSLDFSNYPTKDGRLNMKT